jgi:hypothetical protein
LFQVPSKHSTILFIKLLSTSKTTNYPSSFGSFEFRVPGSHPFQLPTDAKVAATNAIKGRQASTAGLPTIKPTMAWPKR